MSPNTHNKDQNIFDQAKDFMQGKKDEATQKADEMKGQLDNKMSEAQGAAKEQWDNLNKSEADKKASGEKTMGESIGEMLDQAKDATGKAINDDKEKINEMQSDNKKN